jgi:hypothetical protein
MKGLTTLIIIFCCAAANAQYAPQVGITGSDAISAAGGQFTGWATGCTVQRGYMDVANPSLGYASSGDSSLAIGAADDYVVSLGDSGVAVLTFAAPIINGTGTDFAVFENGFVNPTNDSQAFLELAFVEVSSDGVNYYRFPAISNTPDNTQMANGDYMYANLLHNLAGKYPAHYGTPFDLEELAGKAGLDINNVTHVRIVDVTGSVAGHSSYDSAGHVINDPYPTPYPTGGFDLDAVGVIHQAGDAAVNNVAVTAGIQVYPNPATDKVNIAMNDNSSALQATLTDVTGKTLLQQQLTTTNNSITISHYAPGLYYLMLADTKGNKWVEKITKL